MSAALWVQTACIWEACADKAGNVTRRHDFADVTLIDFLLSAAAIAPVLGERRGVGESILLAVRATRQVVRSNTNLGIILLLAPLVHTTDRAALADLLRDLTVDDSRRVYQAIREAVPGGLGQAAQGDVADEPDLPLQQLMSLAADRDRVARQYVTAFAEVFDEVVPDLRAGLTLGIEPAIRRAQLLQLARHGDSLIARKRGPAESDTARHLAKTALDDPAQWTALDAWMRAAGHSRNPGTTADLITAGLFILLATHVVDVASPWGSPRIEWAT